MVLLSNVVAFAVKKALLALNIAAQEEIDALRNVPLDADYVSMPVEKDAAALVSAHKEEGNRKFKAGDYEDACLHYTEAIKLRAAVSHEEAARLYANRSWSRLKLREHNEALLDAEEAVRLDPLWFKAHARVASCLQALEQYAPACAALERAISLAPESSKEELGIELSCCRDTANAFKRKEHLNLQYRGVLSPGSLAAMNASQGRKPTIHRCATKICSANVLQSSSTCCRPGRS
jgi:tetratricopeptide (TPR) repeat protein